MSIPNERWCRLLFLVAAIYDLTLGVIFTFFYGWAFRLLGVESAIPEYEGLLVLIGAFLFVIGVAYAFIYRGELHRNVDLIGVGTLYKAAYFLVALVFLGLDGLPHPVFFWVFGIADFIFFVLMYRCWRTISHHLD